jgi:hypothetical protein
MKKNKFTILFSLILLTIVACSTDEKFSGSPLGNLTVITLLGEISTPVETALSGQEVEFTASLPVGKTFSDTVTVEVTAQRPDGGRIRGYYDILPGASSVTDKIESPGGLVFDATFRLSITAIKLQTVEPGIHYLIESNKKDIDTGDNSIPAVVSNQLQIRFVWESPSTLNRFKLLIDKPDNSPTDVLGNNFTGTALTHLIFNSGNGEGTGTFSFNPGEYIFKLGGQTQLVSPENKKYRIILVFPNGDVKVYVGVYSGLTPTSPALPVLKITKTGVGVNAQYTSEQL